MFDFTNISLPMYPIMMFTSFIIGILVVWDLLKKKGIPTNYIFYSLVLTLMSILIFAKELTILENFDKKITFLEAGFSSIGGVVGLLVSAIFMDWIIDKKKHTFLVAYCKVVPLLYSISKLGCFFVGCCHGFIYDGIGCVIYSKGSYFPIQLLESIVFMLIFLFFYRMENFSISLEIILCALSKLVLDYLRYGHHGMDFSINQYLCLFFIMCGSFCLYRTKKVI